MRKARKNILLSTTSSKHVFSPQPQSAMTNSATGNNRHRKNLTLLELNSNKKIKITKI